jgi:molybdopterin synthase sulfur carrier subunit
MALVWIPSLMRDLTKGRERVRVPGRTVNQLVSNLEKAYPGMGRLLIQEGRLVPGVTVFIDGEAARLGLLEAVKTNSEVHFLPAISGGEDSSSEVRILKKGNDHSSNLTP